MLPIILDLGFIKIYTFGIFLVLAFFWSAFFLWKNIALTSYKEDEIFDALFLSIFGGLFVGRTVHILLNFADFGFDILKYILINGYPGIHVSGGIVGFFLFLLFYTKSKKIPYSRLIDYVIPALLLAIAIGKMGAFFSGAEVGAQTTFLVSLKYPNLDGNRHLTSLYESLILFAGSFFTYRILMNIRREKYYEGFNFLVFWVIYSFTMVITDPMKSFKLMWQGISINLILHAVILLTGSICVLYYFRTSLLKMVYRKHK
ncbi:prolipoprotein diacylglyceryl transferase [Candidatus Woesebacteria bacterium]|nr:prolipoprotein diacylglyceryl transferase [Candidatus Woesebacteria bacterium]